MADETTVGDGLAVAWAKSSPHVAPERWLPLWQHLDDTADVAGMLWDDWVAPSVRWTISVGLPDGEADGRTLLTWLAGAHDVGKASRAFAAQVPSLVGRMTRAGMSIGLFSPQDSSKLRHEVAGAMALDSWLRRHSPLDEDQRAQLTTVVAGHHGGFHRLRDVRSNSSATLLGDGLWVDVRDALLDRAARRSGAKARLGEWAGLQLTQSSVHLMTSLVIVADWIASDEAVFDLLPLDYVPKAHEAASPSARARRAWRHVRLADRWRPVEPDTDVAATFRDRFPGLREEPRPLQRAVASRSATMPAPGLLLVEAPMGVGKTEAAFLAAETLAARSGSAGIAWALPTQATSNAMFSRLRAACERLPAPQGGRQSISLVHGKSALNDEYQDLRFGRPTEVYDDTSPGAPRLSLTAAGWTNGRKRAALATFTTSTIDQILFGSLVARHLVLRQLAFAGKAVVVDEVHSADIYMSTFLDRALEWLGAAGAPVVLLSATLPAARRADLYIAYERGRRLRLGREDDGWEPRARATLERDVGYPSIVSTGDDGPAVTTLHSSSGGARVHVHRLDDDLDALATLLEERLADGGCAVVVRDTVARAQQTAATLDRRLFDTDVTLHHARFLDGVRLDQDATLLRLFGRPGPDSDRPRRHVVVATQVVEQSLDVDFDLMVTDVAPVDVVLQRVGRLHRHHRDDRPARVSEPHCYVTGVDWSGDVPQFARGVSSVYQPWLLLRSLAVLHEHLAGAPIELPGDISRLVQTAYADAASTPAGWDAALRDAWAKFGADVRTRAEKAHHFVLPSPSDLEGTLYGLGHIGVGQVDEESPRAQGYVRDGGDSVEVVVVQRGADETDRVPVWSTELGGELLPFRHVELDRRQARALARCTLRLPASMCRPSAIDAVIVALERNRFEGWDRTPLLARQLALVVDDEGCASVAGFDVRYDERLGLVVERRADR